MNSSSLTARLAALKVIPVITIEDPADILPLGRVLLENDLPVAEITFRTAAAEEAIKRLKAEYPEILIGAGTVINPTLANRAAKAGADFIVSPGLNPSTVAECQQLGIEIIPGVNNPSDIEAALNLGLNTVKFFPAEASGGIKMIKALLAPYNELNLMPTGGIHQDNIVDYLAIKEVIACGLSWMVESSLIHTQNWEEIGRRIQKLKAILKRS